jgi:hypothetical protein
VGKTKFPRHEVPEGWNLEIVLITSKSERILKRFRHLEWSPRGAPDVEPVEAVCSKRGDCDRVHYRVEVVESGGREDER